ncbi:MAG: hypothetical protein P8L18_10335, partial [Verrucomicrobiota bacterium]|nr:hypothetical protein [Verrucomicrobiota bacterium]
MRQTLWLLTLSCTVGVHPMFGQESASIRIAPLGETVALEIETPFEDQYVLETQARLATGERWAPLMQFRGNTDGSRRFVDPICGDKDAKFFRLRRLLDAPPREVSNFRLLDLEGNAHELYYHWPAKGVILLLAGAEPQNILTWSQSLRDIQTRFGEDELLVWPILLSSLDERDDLQASLSNLPASMPILQDTSHAVTRTLSTGEGPEAVLIDPENWSIAYRGPVELVVETGSSTEAWAPLAEAVSELMSGKRPAVSRLAPLGESLGLREVNAASYTETVAPLLQQHCFPCHTPGNIAPWAMTSHGV